MGKTFVTIGNFSIDNVVSADGYVELRKIGGNAVFSALGARYWSQDIGIATTIPLNYPKVWLDELASGGVDLQGVRCVPAAVELEEWFFYRPDGSRIDRLFANYNDYSYLADIVMPLQANEMNQMISGMQETTVKGVSFADFRTQNPLSPSVIPDAYCPIKACHVAPNHFDIHLALVKYLKQQGVFVSLDPAPYSRQVSTENLAELLSFVDVFLPSEKEVKAICPGLSIEDALARLKKMVPVVIVKLGGAGVLVCQQSDNKIRRLPAFPTNAVNLNGAGDSFCGGFIVGMIETGDPLKAAYFGIISSSLTIETNTISEKLLLKRPLAEARLRLYQDFLKNNPGQDTD
jgi:hypothetical protein